MKALLAWLSGIGSALFGFVLPLLRSEVGKVLADRECQALALMAVQVAAGSIFDKGDSKHTQATADLMERLRVKGRSIALGAAATLIEATYQKAVADGNLTPKP